MSSESNSGRDREVDPSEPEDPPYGVRPEGGKPMPLDPADLPGVGYAEDVPVYDTGQGGSGTGAAGAGSGV